MPGILSHGPLPVPRNRRAEAAEKRIAELEGRQCCDCAYSECAQPDAVRCFRFGFWANHDHYCADFRRREESE